MCHYSTWDLFHAWKSNCGCVAFQLRLRPSAVDHHSISRLSTTFSTAYPTELNQQMPAAQLALAHLAPQKISNPDLVRHIALDDPPSVQEAMRHSTLAQSVLAAKCQRLCACPFVCARETDISVRTMQFRRLSKASHGRCWFGCEDVCAGLMVQLLWCGIDVSNRACATIGNIDVTTSVDHVRQKHGQQCP